MSASAQQPPRPVSREEYYRWCESQPRGRFERIDGEIVAMAPERVGHVRMKAAVWQALQRAVAAAGVTCEAYPDGLAVATGESDYQPDALVNCGPAPDSDLVAAPNPVVVVEMLSPSTASTDTGGKLVGYFRVPSIVHYLIVDPVRRVVIHHRRAGEDILTRIVTGGVIEMDPPGISITMDEIYAGANASSA